MCQLALVIVSYYVMHYFLPAQTQIMGIDIPQNKK